MLSFLILAHLQVNEYYKRRSILLIITRTLLLSQVKMFLLKNSLKVVFMVFTLVRTSIYFLFYPLLGFVSFIHKQQQLISLSFMRQGFTKILTSSSDLHYGPHILKLFMGSDYFISGQPANSRQTYHNFLGRSDIFLGGDYFVSGQPVNSRQICHNFLGRSDIFLGSDYFVSGQTCHNFLGKSDIFLDSDFLFPGRP